MQRDCLVKIAVLGSGSASEDSPAGRKAFRIGELVASKAAVLLTGGCEGLPHAAVQGAHKARGLTVAVSPAMNGPAHVGYYHYPLDSRIMIFTGMGRKGRNVILVRSADACVFLGGGMGTLNEFTIAFDELGSECAIGVLTQSGGLSDELDRIASLVGRSCAASLIMEADPERLLERLFAHIRSR